MTSRQAMACIIAAALPLALAACQATKTRVGEGREIQATFRYRTLRATLYDDTLRIRSIAAAAEATLRDRGYTIASEDVTDDRARIEGWPPTTPGRWGDKPFDRVLINVLPVKQGIELQITIDPAGNQQASKTIMDELLHKLGR